MGKGLIYYKVRKNHNPPNQFVESLWLPPPPRAR